MAAITGNDRQPLPKPLPPGAAPSPLPHSQKGIHRELNSTNLLLALFSNSGVTGYTALILPIAVQEMVFAGWLLVKGFTPSPLTFRAPSENSTTLGRNTSTV